jgi:hypothetical protein
MACAEGWEPVAGSLNPTLWNNSASPLRCTERPSPNGTTSRRDILASSGARDGLPAG